MRFLCSKCKEMYRTHQPIWRCKCGGYLNLDYNAQFSLDEIACRNTSMWRYREAIPIETESEIVTLGEGFTPLLPVNISGKEVSIKQEQLFSTGSFKDRGASVMVTKIKELGIERVVEDSSGNAGCSVAAYCAAAGIGCDIYVPADTSPGKLAQIEAYGAKLHRIPGSREDTANAVLAAAENTYYASHTWNPYFFHGTKTVAFEICEQLGWRQPDVVILPVGNGTLLLGAYIGFVELKEAGITVDLPRIIAVQTENCSPLAHAFERNMRDVPLVPTSKTIAEGIAIATPLRGRQLLEAVRTSGGSFITVNEKEIVTALKEMRKKGFYIEPTSAATIAGVYKYLDRPDSIKENQLIVSVFTGHGLKSGGKAII